MAYCKMIPLLILALGTCQLLGTAASSSLSGINFDAPKNVIRKGIERIPQILDRIPFLNQNLNQPLVTPHPFRNDYHNFNGNTNTFKPTFNKDLFVPPQPSSKITIEKNQNNASSNQASYKNEDAQGPENTIENSGSVLTNTPAKYIKKEIEAATEIDYQLNTDYTATATTDDEWMTTDDPLNRIGAPPAVVASLLG